MASTIAAEHNLIPQSHPWDCIRFRRCNRLFGVSKSRKSVSTFINFNVSLFTLCETTVIGKIPEEGVGFPRDTACPNIATGH